MDVGAVAIVAVLQQYVSKNNKTLTNCLLTFGISIRRSIFSDDLTD